MTLIRQLADLPAAARGGAVSIGNFDGVHLGHAQIAAQLHEQAKRVGGPAVAFTFDPPPAALLRPGTKPPPLTTVEQRESLLGELGVDFVIAYPTDRALLQLTPAAFFERIIREVLDARAIVEGPNFGFGRDRSGNVETLAELCQQHAISLTVVDPLEEDGIISSSRIRQLIEQGDVAAAGELLGRPHRVAGQVVRGAGRGAKIGFPTANLENVLQLLPAAGVYAGRGYLGQDSWGAAVNLGPNPTFGEEALKLEVHLIDCQRDLYDQPLQVDFLQKLRDVRRFAGPADLQEQLAADVAQAKAIAG